MKLTPMTSFVLEQYINFSNDHIELAMLRCYRYAKFLSQTLEIWMFVPCDLDGKILEEPKMFYEEKYLKNLKGVEIDIALEVNKRVLEYQEAKSRCLFEGFKLGPSFKESTKVYVVGNGKATVGIGFNYGIHTTIENLIDKDITLSETAIKQICI